MSERNFGDLGEDYLEPPPNDYDAIKAFRNGLAELERELWRTTSGRVSLKQATIQHNWELWPKTTEAR